MLENRSVVARGWGVKPLSLLTTKREHQGASGVMGLVSILIMVVLHKLIHMLKFIALYTKKVNFTAYLFKNEIESGKV